MVGQAMESQIYNKITSKIIIKSLNEWLVAHAKIQSEFNTKKDILVFYVIVLMDKKLADL